MKSSQKPTKDGKPKAVKKHLSAAREKIKQWEAKQRPLLPCPVCGGPRHTVKGDTKNRLCYNCRHPEMEFQRLDILYQTQPEKLNDHDFPEWPEIKKTACKLLGVEFFDLEAWKRVKEWLTGRHGKTAVEMLSMKRAELLALLQAAVKSDPKDVIRNSKAYKGYSDTERGVLDAIIDSPCPLTGKEITKITGQEQSTLTSRIIPKLREEFSIENRRGVGYSLDLEKPFNACSKEQH